MYMVLERWLEREAAAFVRSREPDARPDYSCGDATLKALVDYGYVLADGPEAYPTHKAYTAEFIDRMLPTIRKILECVDPRISDSFSLEADLSPLVSEGWLARSEGGEYVIRKHGVKMLAYADRMYPADLLIGSSTD